ALTASAGSVDCGAVEACAGLSVVADAGCQDGSLTCNGTVSVSCQSAYGGPIVDRDCAKYSTVNAQCDRAGCTPDPGTCVAGVRRCNASTPNIVEQCRADPRLGTFFAGIDDCNIFNRTCVQTSDTTASCVGKGEGCASGGRCSGTELIDCVS